MTLLSDMAWVMYVIRLLNLETAVNAMPDISMTDKEKTDLLLIKLRVRFKLHVTTRVQKAANQSHWILRFAFKTYP